MRRGRPVVVPNSPPACAQRVGQVAVELGRKRARADPRLVGLDHAPHLVDVLGPHAGADARRAGDRVGRGDERIRAVIDVQQRALGALEEQVTVGVEQVPGELRRVGDVLLEPVAVGGVLLDHRVQVERGVLVVRAQGEPLGLERGDDLLAQDLGVEQVLHADAQARRLVGVAGADAAARGADLEISQLLLAGHVEQQVVGHDQVGVGGDAQVPVSMPRRRRAVELVRENARVDDHAVADHAQRVAVQDPARDQMELERLAVADDRVAGVVAALEADHRVRPLGEQVGDLSLSLVAPLGADDHGRGHASSLGGGDTARCQAGRAHGPAGRQGQRSRRLPGARPCVR